MVDVYPQYATVVAKIDLDHARPAQFLRLSIELEAVRRLTADASAETAKDLREVLVRQAAVATQETDDVFDSIDREFHRILYEKTGILELWASVRRQSVHLDRLRRLHLPMPGKMQTVLTEHEAIVDAIVSGRPAHAEMALRKHLCATLSIIDVISSVPHLYKDLRLRRSVKPAPSCVSAPVSTPSIWPPPIMPARSSSPAARTRRSIFPRTEWSTAARRKQGGQRDQAGDGTERQRARRQAGRACGGARRGRHEGLLLARLSARAHLGMPHPAHVGQLRRPALPTRRNHLSAQ